MIVTPVFSSAFKILNKSGQLVQFTPNKAQKHYKQNKSHRDLILKARQLGFTTDEKLEDLDFTLQNNGVSSLTIADTNPHAHEIFDKIWVAYKYLPDEIRSLYELTRESIGKIKFGNTDSAITIDTSGRSGTYQRVHISEFDSMDKKRQREIISGTFETVPKDGRIVIETTTNHNVSSGLFQELFQGAINGENEFKPHFYAWYWNEEYQEVVPDGLKDWKVDYESLAKRYEVQPNIQDRFNLTDQQMFWYYSKLKTLKYLIHENYPTTWNDAFITPTDKLVIDRYALQKIEVKKPISETEEMAIFEEPIENEIYYIGADVGQGYSNSDFSTGIVIRQSTGSVVARLRVRLKDYVFAKLLATLGNKYNKAVIIVERNAGYAVINALLDNENYHTLYTDEDKKIGFYTTSKNKKDMFYGANGLNKAIDDELIQINDQKILDELYVFESKDDTNGMGAKSGYFDDLVMGLAICWYVMNSKKDTSNWIRSNLTW